MEVVVCDFDAWASGEYEWEMRGSGGVVGVNCCRRSSADVGRLRITLIQREDIRRVVRG